MSVRANIGANLLKRGEYAQAAKYFDLQLALSPGDIYALASRGRCALCLKDMDKAESLLLKASDIAPDSPHVLLNMARLHAARGRRGEALESARKAHEAQGSVESAIVLASMLALNRQLSEARDIAESACGLDPTYAPGFDVLAKLRLHAGDLEGAAAAAEKAVTLRPNLSASWEILAEWHIQNRRVDTARDALRHALEHDPGNNKYKVDLAKLESLAENHDEALKLLRDVEKDLPDNTTVAVEALLRLGDELRAHQKLDEAHDAYTRALSLRPDIPVLECSLAALCVEQGKLEEAETHLESCEKISKAGLPPAARLVRGELAMSRSEFEKAFTLFEEHLEFLMHSYPRGFIYPTTSYMDVADADVAIMDFNKAMMRLEVPFFPVFGTLLGLVREGDLLPHDKDLDVGLYYDVPVVNLVAALTHFGFAPNARSRSDPRETTFNYSVVHRKSGLGIDFFFFKEHEDGFVTGANLQPRPLLFYFPYFELRKAQWNGLDWWVPADPEKFLECVYGQEWRVPDANFDTMVSGRNITEESRPMAISFGYNRLVERMLRCQWGKAAGYVQQLRRYRNSPVFDALEGWLRQRQEEDKQP